MLKEVNDVSQGNMLAERPVQGKGKKQESALVGPGSVLGAAAFLSSTRSRAAVRAAGTCRLAAFGPQELEALLVSALANCNGCKCEGHMLSCTSIHLFFSHCTILVFLYTGSSQ